MTSRSINAAFGFLVPLTLVALPAHASLYSLTATGTVSFNSSSDSTIPAGTPWSFELTYDTAAPDLASIDPTFGQFANTASPPALMHFHYKAGSYEVTLDDPTDFGAGSDMLVTFTAVNAIDININAPTLFPHLAGGAVSFHADFNAFSMAPVFTTDGLPTNTALSPASFDQSSVTLLPPSGVITGSTIATLAILAVPEPSTCAFASLIFLWTPVTLRRSLCRHVSLTTHAIRHS